ncbi:NAD(P)H-hydrate dehydratase [Loktanella sp. SALINAS62]|uniref:NAD(P)H-hydrate dehydratase n=1 Tax=Loktanella sp. SALINAS62 TaxID=2706124 RepID=UPI001B8D181B|nr:NAD(P)H-hydrate dehydratase [Loktanella sp. SALINAS62]
MSNVVTTDQMRTIEQRAIAAGTVRAGTLMERAGQAAVDVIRSWMNVVDGNRRKAVVLCGPGRNGGDGFVVARLLAQAGWTVDVHFAGDADRLPVEARANHDRWQDIGTIAPDDQMPDANADLVIDALFGIGLSRPLEGMARVWAATIGQSKETVVALDMPSGLCGDSGRVLGDVAVTAGLTVSFHAGKVGHYLAQAPQHCGRVVTVDIGLKTPSDMTLTQLVTPPSGLGKALGKHKYDHGHALILAGGVGQGGAARMAARAALRIGAGAVTVGCPPSALIENAAQLNAIMLRSIKDGSALSKALGDQRFSAVCLGPGLGLTDRQAGLVTAALDWAGDLPDRRGLVLDADALTILSRSATLFEKLGPNCVLTPHDGEFARLFPDIADQLNSTATRGPAFSRLDAARLAAMRAGCTILLKGPDTVIATHTGQAAIHAGIYERATPWLATAGAGDVLSGMITGLLARGMRVEAAAAQAAWVHVMAAQHYGPGLIAEDLPDLIPAILRQLEPGSDGAAQ